MSEIWAARKDDELIHTSPLADIASAVAEVAVYAVATAAVSAAAAAAAPALAGVAVLGAAATAASGCVGAGLIVGFASSLTGVGEHIGNGCDAVANWLFPPRRFRHDPHRFPQCFHQRQTGGARRRPAAHRR
ncbi:hypothetical protein [Serratia ficaria]|uniref:hypothetical protein n=1 Tax=Serratia ficaria TaxID=61651 RepID=UPI0021C9F443|nr:hypothetical protein [Serratia ficaria]